MFDYIRLVLCRRGDVGLCCTRASFSFPAHIRSPLCLSAALL